MLGLAYRHLTLPLVRWPSNQAIFRRGNWPALSIRVVVTAGSRGGRGACGLASPLTRMVATPCYRAPEVPPAPPATTVAMLLFSRAVAAQGQAFASSSRQRSNATDSS